ncbi:hypothetical protein B0H10DRAFT_2208832 [Mycena sp. CBHHK59/15]|nr:hypothetical protein B0H10DRAFT_2208832 [Mycena sp. CBHHK59/15]
MCSFSGAMLLFPAKDRVLHPSVLISILLVCCSMITSMICHITSPRMLMANPSKINRLNILLSYANYFDLNTTTLALNTTSIWIGGILAGVSFGKVTDIIGHCPSLFYAMVITLTMVVLQTTAQNVCMFIAARILVGFDTSASMLSGPMYLVEMLPFKWRAWGLSIFNNIYHIGGLIVAGITYGT